MPSNPLSYSASLSFSVGASSSSTVVLSPGTSLFLSINTLFFDAVALFLNAGASYFGVNTLSLGISASSLGAGASAMSLDVFLSAYTPLLASIPLLSTLLILFCIP